ncbi:MAG: PilC/PilY family type IV pilus protein [Spongiibacteraceae bacterium]
MNKLTSKSKALLLGFASIFFASLPVLADDTEIYFGSSTAGVKNNILFVIDTSGSMASYDGDSTTRMDELKTAFKSLLGQLDNVNVGLMRFSNPGGPVLYPVSNINETISASGTTGVINASVNSANDDGYQQSSTGVVKLDTSNLELGTEAVGGATYYTYTKRISDNKNDADGCINNDNTNRDSDSIRTYSSGCTNNQRVAGVRFETVTIPKPVSGTPVTIDSAYIEFTVSGTGGTAPIDLIFKGEKVSGDTFSENTNNRKPTVRWNNTSNITSAGMSWSMSTLPTTNTVVTSPDISAIVQEAINDSSWASGNALTILYKHDPSKTSTGRADFYSADSNNADTQAPRLVVNYHVGTGTPTTYDTTTALRFTDINLPRNATVTSAYLTFTAASSLTDTTALTIKAHASDNSPALSTTSNDITGRSTTSAAVTWGASSSPAMANWSAGTDYQSPNVATIVQEIANRSNWCGGNAITFLISGSGHRIASAYENGSTTAPKLVINYDVSSVPTNGTTCKKSSMTRQIAGGSDDAQEDSGTTPANITNNTLRLAANQSGSQWSPTYVASDVGLRFTNIRIPKNSTIQSAYIQFQASGGDSSSLDLTIKGEATDDASTFAAADGSVSARSKTSQAVTWSPSSWTSGNAYLSPDVSSIVQAIVNRSGWAVGNDLAFIISSSSTSNVRRAYSYNGSQGSAPKLIINYIDDGSVSTGYTVRDKLIELVDSLSPNGMTPLQDTFYEGVQYFRGEAVDYGKVRGGGPYSYTRVSHPNSLVSGSYTSITPTGCTDSSSGTCASETINGSPVYKSPITYACQTNHIVLLTDGLPNSDHSTTKIRSLPSFPSASCSFSGAGECVPELANWVSAAADMSSTLAGSQRVIVDTIAFYQDADGNDFLEQTASQGGGSYSVATSSADLLTALQKITTNTISEDTSFVAAGTAVNAFNRTLNLDDLYFSVFRPELTPKWPGNLKKYKLAFNSAGSPYIKDANGVDAVDATTGFFKDSSQSFWSAVTDGPSVTKGGAGSLITDYTARKLYTNTSEPTASTPVDLAAGSHANELDRSTNTLLTKAMFGVSAYTDAEYQNLVDWVRGKNVKAEKAADGTTPTTRFVFADPLHSRPIAVTYGGSETNPDTTLFVSTNSGTLHAIDNDDGSEVFGFIPSDLLPLQKTLYENAQGTDHPYGLDGSMTSWIIDPDGDSVVLNSGGSIQTNNKVLLFSGMRRGGRNYYGLDVTDRTHPKLIWSKKGGVTAGFSAMGQTWSQPIRARISVGGVSKRVLVLGGGYDPAQDTTTVRQTDSMGAAIYIIDAETGDLIWSGGKGTVPTDFTTNFNDMVYSIPSTVTGADINGDGLMDYFFVGDMGGQVWRFDVNNAAADSSTLIKGGVIADLGVASGSNVASNNRRFYHAPSLFLGKNNGTLYLGVAIGSGWRAHPLSEDTTDKFYMIRQYDVFSAPSTYAKVTESQLYNADSNLIKQGTTSQQASEAATLATKSGWFLTMGLGEKVLSTPLILNGEITFDTYQPSIDASADPCTPQTGTNRSYTVNVDDASPSYDYNSDGSLTSADRAKVLRVPGISDGAKLIITKDGAATVEGTQTSKTDLKDLGDVQRIYWYEKRAR